MFWFGEWVGDAKTYLGRQFRQNVARHGGRSHIPVTHGVGAAGAPFFGFVHDLTGSYRSSFRAFVAALLRAAFLSLAVQGRAKVPRW